MQQLKSYQAPGGMELRSPDVPERSQKDCFRRVAEAGFDGMCIDPTAAEIPDVGSTKKLYRNDGLACMVNVISGVMPIKPEDAVPVVQRWMQEADDHAMPLLFETHRDGLLNDLYYTLQLMDLVPEMRLCADLSHFVVDREMRNPIGETDQAYISSILDRSDCLQGRIATREQIQIQIDFPQHQEWVEIFKGWWKEGMRAWRQRNGDQGELVFLCELGPPPYAITDRRQNELSNRWEESLRLRDWAQQLWSELED